MDRHTPKLAQVTLSGAPVKIFDRQQAPKLIPLILYNRSTETVRLLFGDGTLPDPDAWLPIPAGKTVELNPNIDCYGYVPTGVPATVTVATGIRYIDGPGIESAGASAPRTLLDMSRGQRELLAEIALYQRIMLRYFAEWQGESYQETDVDPSLIGTP